MKHYPLFALTLALLLVVGCSSSKMPADPAAAAQEAAEALPDVPAAVGVWDMMIVGTPQGDIPGRMSLVQAGGEYKGEVSISALQQTVPAEKVSFVDNLLKAEAAFLMDSGVMVAQFSVTVQGDTFEGEITTPEFGTFKVTGTRVTTP